jgi:hypothetical protein
MPRPSRPRWRSAGRRRSTTHPSSGRSAAEDGGGETFLARARNGRSPGEESRSVRRCGTGDRGAAVLWPDQAMRGQMARAGPTALRRRRGGYRVTRARGQPDWAKEKKPLRTDGRHCMSRPLATQLPYGESCHAQWRRRLDPIEALQRPRSARVGDQRSARQHPLKSRTAEAHPGLAGDVSDQAISRRRASSGVGRGAESTMRVQAVAATTIAPITAMACCQPSADMPMCARPSVA